jgi:probable rRNA maturation factor
MGLRLSLQFADPRHRESLSRQFVRRCLAHALQAPAELTVRWVDEDEMRALNGQYRRKDYPTNVLTFAYESEPTVVADIVLCPAVIEREAREQRKTLRDHYAHMLVHSALHAQGFEHETDEDAQDMQALEQAIMARLGFGDPYAA